MQNDAIEAAYHKVIAAVKELVLKHGGDTIYERDLKLDPECFVGIHSFFTSTFYWQLDCDFDNTLLIGYAFDRCPFKDEVRELMSTLQIDGNSHQQDFANGYSGFYEAVINGVDSTYITTLGYV